MKGKHKPFDRELYEKWDAPAKQAVASHLSYHGYEVVIPEEDYWVDLYAYFRRHPGIDIKFHHEVEVSQVWKKRKYPFPHGSIPERKKRLREKIDGPLFFWQLRSDLQAAVCFSSAYLRPEFLIEVPNKYVNEGEFFYRPPLRFGRYIDPLMKGEI
jgi:hypothetical protein